MKDNHDMKVNINRDVFVGMAGYRSINEMEDALSRARSIDIGKVDSDGIAEFSDIRIDDSLPVEERIASLMRQTKNPYCFKYNGMIVKISFAGKKSLEDCLADCFISR